MCSCSNVWDVFSDIYGVLKVVVFLFIYMKSLHFCPGVSILMLSAVTAPFDRRKLFFFFYSPFKKICKIILKRNPT